MKYLLVLAVVGCAHALAAPLVPDYLGAWDNFKLADNKLRTHLAFTKPNKEQVNYMVILAALGLSADFEVFLHLKYDQNWELSVFLAEIIGRVSPKVVQTFAKGKLALAERKTAKLRALIKKLCGVGQKGLLGLPPKCNEEVDKEVKKSKELQKESALLLPLGDLSYEYLTREPEFVDAAKKNKVDEYLEHGKQRLRKLQADLVKVFRVLFGA